MNTIEDVSDAWGDELQAFLASDCKCFHVTVDERSRDGVLASWFACMEKMPSDHLFFVLQGPALGARGWDLRADELYAQYEFLRNELARGGRAIPALGQDVRPQIGSLGGLARFSTILGRVEAGLRFRRSSLVIVLAPITDSSRDPNWTRDLRMLIEGTRSLPRLRFAMTELAPGNAAEIADALQAQKATVLLDPSILRNQLVERLRAQASAPPGATGFRASGAAGPKVAPPSRPGFRRTAPSPAVLESADAEMRLMLDSNAQETLRRSSSLALACAAEGNMRGAVDAQSVIVAACEAAHAPKSTASNMLLLGLFRAALGEPRNAREICERARELAVANNAPELARKALLFMASIELAAQRHLEAAVLYRRLAAEARDVGDVLMAIEGLRACGEALISADRMPDAVTAFREALEVAQKADQMQAKLSAAPSLAKSLASLCRKRGLSEQAGEYDRIAEQLSGALDEVRS